MKIARWFLEITLDAETIRWCNSHEDLTFESHTFTGLGTRWKPPESLKRSASLKSEKFELEFDSSRQTDNTDPIGDLLDKTWRRRQVRLRRLAWDVGDTPDDGDVLEDERGRIRNLSDEVEIEKSPTITMEIESGMLAYLERRMETRSPARQNIVFPTDKGFDLIAQLEGATLPWRTKHKKVGTVQVELQDKYEPVPRKLMLGRFVDSGSFVAAFTNGQQRKYLQRIYAIADHRINKLDKVWVNGDLVRNAALTHGARTLLRIDGDNNEDRCWITFYDGRYNQSADSYLVSAESTWTTNHKLSGVAYVIVEHLWDSDLPENFDYRFGGEGALLYDRRADSTAGGSGTQRWDDPSTWAYSTNAMVAIDHYRSGMRVLSTDTAIWFGVGEDVDAVPYAEFEALADHCDENVALKAGGTQKRYEVNGILSAEDSHDRNLELLANQMAARPIDQGGRLAIRPPIVRTSVITLTDGDLARGSKTKIDPGGNIDDMVNTIEGRFVNPANDYKRDDFPPVQIGAYVDADGGEISDSLNLSLEISGERAQRIAKLKIEDSRRILVLDETYLSAARVIVPGEWFTRQSAMRGFAAGKTFIAEKVERFLDGSIRVQSSEVDPDQLVWDETTAVDLSVPPTFPQVSLPDIPVPVVSASAVELGSGSNLLPGIRLDVTLPIDLAEVTADRTEMEYGLSDGASSPGISGQSFFLRFDPTRQTLIYSGFLPSTDYVVRFRGRDGVRVGDWSAFQMVTTTANASATAANVVPWTGVYGTGRPDDNADVTGSHVALAVVDQGDLATLDQVTWAVHVTGTGRPEDYATRSRVFRQQAAPSSPNTNDIWVVLDGSGNPTAIKAWNGSAWILGADLTSLNVALGIIDQGWGATASEADASNAQVPIGANAIGNSEFYAGLSGWTGTALSGNTATMSLRTPGSTYALPTRATLMVRQPDAGTAGAFDVRWRPTNSAGALSYALKVAPGDIVAALARVSSHRCRSDLRIQWLDASGNHISSSGPSSNNANSSSSTEPDTWPLLSVLGTAPAGSVWAGIHLRKGATTSGADSYLFVHKPMLAKMQPGASVVPEYSPGIVQDVESGADQTGGHTALAILDQGNQATADAGRGNTAARPASTGSWSWYVNTETGTLQLDVPTDGWINVASVGVEPISISRSGSFVHTKIGTGTNSTGAVTFSATGGTAPYTWTHEKILQTPATPAVSITSATGASTGASATSGATGVEVQGQVLTTCTDAAGRKQQFTSPLDLSWET